MQVYVYDFYEKLCHDGNVLVAGQAGAGKSVILNGIIMTAMLNGNHMMLLDPKGGAEFGIYKDCEEVDGFAKDVDDFAPLLKKAVEIMNKRYADMERAHKRTSDEPEFYVIIDEYGDMMSDRKKECLPYLLKIARKGRAARVRLILATQVPSRQVVTADISANMHTIVALHTRSSLDSRVIIREPGAEKLAVGEAMVQHRDAFGVSKERVPMYDDETLENVALLRTPLDKRWREVVA